MKYLAGLLFCIAFVHCNENRTVKIKKNVNDSLDNIAEIKSDDVKMNSAILKARETFSEFVKQIKTCDDCMSFNVKIRYDVGANGGEHLWANDLHFKGQKLFAVINNEPENPIGVKIGDTVEVNLDHVSDWMYVKNGQLMGGYTVKLIYEGLTEAEKKQMEIDLGAKN